MNEGRDREGKEGKEWVTLNVASNNCKQKPFMVFQLFKDMVNM